MAEEVMASNLVVGDRRSLNDSLIEEEEIERIGRTTNPSAPSIGSLGPEAVRSPSRLRPGLDMDEGRRGLGAGRR